MAQRGALPGREEHVATLVHLTDMHLLVTSNGDVLGDAERSHLANSFVFLKRLLHRVKRRVPLVDNLQFHDPNALLGLEDSLRQFVADHQRDSPSVPVIGLQTGDVDTLGPDRRGGTAVFHGFEYLRSILRPHVGLANQPCFDVYGNHDVWAGVLPLFAAGTVAQNFVDITTVVGHYPNRNDVPAGPVNIEIYRLNSIDPDVVTASLARGVIGPQPITNAADPPSVALAQLEGLVTARASATPVIRVVMMHHPPSPFDAGLLMRHAIAHVKGAGRLGQLLGRSSFPIVHFVVAGHRHRLDPNRKRWYHGVAPAQLPLPTRTMQLVAESPTACNDLVNPNDAAAVRASARDDGSRSFSVYRLYADLGNNVVRAERTRYAFSRAAGERTDRRGTRAFSPAETDDFSGLRLHE